MSFLELDKVSLELPVYDTVGRSLRSTITRNIPVGGRIEYTNRSTSIRALDDVSLSLKTGDRVALFGHNGAGKTSLLKVLAGFYEPTKGARRAEGKIAALLELVAGMDFNLTGSENILLCGRLYGLSRSEVADRMESIAEFSELGSYLDLPVRLYSQGMVLRLAFSICSSIHFDILLLDEWVGAGDQSFIEKAQARMSQLVFQSAILVLATHSISVAKQLCNKAVYLEHGRIIKQADIDTIIAFQEARTRGAAS